LARQRRPVRLKTASSRCRMVRAPPGAR